MKIKIRTKTNESTIHKSLLDSCVTPITPFKPSTRLLSPSNNANGLSNRCLLLSAVIHILISIALIALFIKALIEPMLYADLLCYTQDLFGNKRPCNLRNDELTQVYSTSIANLIDELWHSEEYIVCIILVCASIIFPCMHIINNLRLVFQSNTNINIGKDANFKHWSTSIIFIYLNKLSMIYIFGCILLYVNVVFHFPRTIKLHTSKTKASMDYISRHPPRRSELQCIRKL